MWLKCMEFTGVLKYNPMKTILKKFREEFDLKLAIGLCVALICVFILGIKFPSFPIIKATLFVAGSAVILFALDKILKQFE